MSNRASTQRRCRNRRNINLREAHRNQNILLGKLYKTDVHVRRKRVIAQLIKNRRLRPVYMEFCLYIQ